MKKILCFGDSNTWGHNPVDCSKLEKPWTVWLKNIVPEYEIVSDGVCGRATTHYLENEDKTNGLKDFRERYLSGENDFDLIIIMLGTNDVLNNIDFSNQKTADVLKIYVEECRAKFGKDKPKILLVSPILINDNCLTHPIFKDLYSEKSIEKSMHFSEYISKLADEEDTYFMNAADYAKASDITEYIWFQRNIRNLQMRSRIKLKKYCHKVK